MMSGRQTSRLISRQLSELVTEHQGIIRAFLTRLCRNSALADDLAQETFIKAFENIEGLNNPKAAKAWLFKIAYHCYMSHARKSARRTSLDDNNIAPEYTSEHPRNGARIDITAAMNALPPQQRAVIMMALSYGMSHSEVAKASNLPLGTVKSHINRGRAQLQASLNAYKTV